MHGPIRIVMMGNMSDMLKHVLYDLIARMHEMPLPCRKYLQWEDQHEEENHNTRHETILRRLGCQLTLALSATAPRLRTCKLLRFAVQVNVALHCRCVTHGATSVPASNQDRLEHGATQLLAKRPSHARLRLYPAS